MKAQALIDLLKDHPETEVRIPIQRSSPGIGSKPSVDVKEVHVGFDWDHGSLFLIPEMTGHLLHDRDGSMTKAAHKLSELLGWLLAHDKDKITDEQLIGIAKRIAGFDKAKEALHEQARSELGAEA